MCCVIYVCACVYNHMTVCVPGPRVINHSSNLSARSLCVGDIKVLISTGSQH